MPDLEQFDGGNGSSDATGFVERTVTLAELLFDLGLESTLTIGGYDDCVIGILERYGMERIVVYDREKVIHKLMDGGIESYAAALASYKSQQLGAWHGDKTPGFLIRLPGI